MGKVLALEPANRNRAGPHGTPSADLRAIRTGTGTGLPALPSNDLKPIPDGMAELLRQLDQPTAKPSER